MTKEDFLSRLKENKKTFKSAEELIEYQLPVLQYYLKHYQMPFYTADETKLDILVDFSKIELVSSEANSNLYNMNRAFEGLTKRIGEFE